MTSGVYPRKPGQVLEVPRRFNDDEIAKIKADKAKGLSTKFLSSKWRTSEKLIRQVINGTGAYKESK
jgi:hypothetical protein